MSHGSATSTFSRKHVSIHRCYTNRCYVNKARDTILTGRGTWIKTYEDTGSGIGYAKTGRPQSGPQFPHVLPTIYDRENIQNRNRTTNVLDSVSSHHTNRGEKGPNKSDDCDIIGVDCEVH